MVVEWLESALADLREIAAFVEMDKPEAARNLVQAIRARTLLLAHTPFLGRATEMDQVRELVVHRSPDDFSVPRGCHPCWR